MTEENMNQEVEVQYIDLAPGLSPGDVTELGAYLASSGFTTLEARAVIADAQQMAMQNAMGMMPKLLERVRKIQEARLLQIYTQIRMLPNAMGYVNRDRVLSIITNVSASTPRS
jgi:hypothetical protein